MNNYRDRDLIRNEKGQSIRIFGHLLAPIFSVEVDLSSPQPKLHQRKTVLL